MGAACGMSLPVATASAEPQGGLFAITDENDAWSNFFGPHQDRHYTHGIKLTYMAPDDVLTNFTSWLNDLPKLWITPNAGQLGTVAGQNMYTPQNILDPNPIPTDRPYAGWLYGGLVYQRRDDAGGHFAQMENFEINAGIVGPYSQADWTQELIHHWRFPEDIPQGWHNQIHNEPGVELKYARLLRWSLNDSTAKYFDVLPRAGFELGNVDTFGTVGGAARLGYNLPPDFGMQIIDSPASWTGGKVERSQGFAIYTFAGFDGRAVGRDITLDGNTFRSSARVNKFNFVNDLSWGIACQPCRHLEISYEQITRSREFHDQNGKDVFGSIDMKFMFSF